MFKLFAILLLPGLVMGQGSVQGHWEQSERLSPSLTEGPDGRLYHVKAVPDSGSGRSRGLKKRRPSLNGGNDFSGIENGNISGSASADKRSRMDTRQKNGNRKKIEKKADSTANPTLADAQRPLSSLSSIEAVSPVASPRKSKSRPPSRRSRKRKRGKGKKRKRKGKKGKGKKGKKANNVKKTKRPASSPKPTAGTIVEPPSLAPTMSPSRAMTTQIPSESVPDGSELPSEVFPSPEASPVATEQPSSETGQSPAPSSGEGTSGPSSETGQSPPPSSGEGTSGPSSDTTQSPAPTSGEQSPSAMPFVDTSQPSSESTTVESLTAVPSKSPESASSVSPSPSVLPSVLSSVTLSPILLGAPSSTPTTGVSISNSPSTTIQSTTSPMGLETASIAPSVLGQTSAPVPTASAVLGTASIAPSTLAQAFVSETSAAAQAAANQATETGQNLLNQAAAAAAAAGLLDAPGSSRVHESTPVPTNGLFLSRLRNRRRRRANKYGKK